MASDGPARHLRIRPFRAGDAPALARLFHAAVREAGRRDYDARQVAAWSPAVPDPADFLRRSGDGRVFLVAVDDADRPLAYGDVAADGYLDHLYCRPDAIGTGVGAALYDALERAAAVSGLSSLYVDASETARRLLLHKGFVVERRNEVVRNGVALHNYRMVKALR